MGFINPYTETTRGSQVELYEFRQPTTIGNLSASASGFEKLDMQSGKQKAAISLTEEPLMPPLQ